MRPFFFRVLINTSRNHLRDRTRRSAHESKARGARRWSGSHEERDQAEWIQTRLAKLEAPLREAVALKCLEGLTFAEVAEALGCPPGRPPRESDGGSSSSGSRNKPRQAQVLRPGRRRAQ
ncbi:MAG: sigma-70 family RNA polymerase sigma factor [Planctomycetes bacterium]|nr:sigma-70 family RNA polymerase sigma factor [Planctomycetota bacterium]